MRGLGLAQKLCLLLWLKVIVVETPESWGYLGLVNTDGIVQSVNIRKLIVNFFDLVNLN